MFITLEGIEGCGKTTQLGYIDTFLQDRGVAYTLTREPGGTRCGEQIRSILLDPQTTGLTPTAELLLYFADRAEHVEAVILPALSQGHIVVSDRFFDATVVYQGYARGLDVDLIERLHGLLFHGVLPDVTLLLDLDPEVGLARAWKGIGNGERETGESRFEEEDLSFHRRVREGYLDRARNDPDRFQIIDASGSETQVRDHILSVLDAKLNHPRAVR